MTKAEAKLANQQWQVDRGKELDAAQCKLAKQALPGVRFLWQH
jgi:hypothetical protein